MEFIRFLNNNILWGIPMLVFMLCLGVYLTIATKGVIFLKFPTVLKLTVGSLFKKNGHEKKGTVSPFAAVSTALAATVGTGNIVGVAIAVRTGGPGAVFWMWISALFGMVIKYSEVLLAIHYRERNKMGEYVGGPMYYMSKALSSDFLALIFCVFAIFSSFGIGNTVQANSLASVLFSSFNIPVWVSGLVLSLFCGAVLIGGIKRISTVAQILVPFMAFFYIAAACAVLFINAPELPSALSMILTSAFTPTAAKGGFSGATVMYAVRIGVSRGLFTNEAGLGSAPIAHASAATDHPVRQGLWGAFEVFFDTIVMCTITALVIISSEVWTLPQGTNDGLLSHIAFENSIHSGGYLVSIGLVFFAFASIIAWYYYGEKCVEFLFGGKYRSLYRTLYVSACFFGCISNIEKIWEISDTLNALMAIPNLTALFFLAPVVAKLTMEFFKM